MSQFYRIICLCICSLEIIGMLLYYYNINKNFLALIVIIADLLLVIFIILYFYVRCYLKNNDYFIMEYVYIPVSNESKEIKTFI